MLQLRPVPSGSTFSLLILYKKMCLNKENKLFCLFNLKIKLLNLLSVIHYHREPLGPETSIAEVNKNIVKGRGGGGGQEEGGK